MLCTTAAPAAVAARACCLRRCTWPCRAPSLAPRCQAQVRFGEGPGSRQSIGFNLVAGLMTGCLLILMPVLFPPPPPLPCLQVEAATTAACSALAAVSLACAALCRPCHGSTAPPPCCATCCPPMAQHPLAPPLSSSGSRPLARLSGPAAAAACCRPRCRQHRGAAQRQPQRPQHLLRPAQQAQSSWCLWGRGPRSQVLPAQARCRPSLLCTWAASSATASCLLRQARPHWASRAAYPLWTSAWAAQAGPQGPASSLEQWGYMWMLPAGSP